MDKLLTIATMKIFNTQLQKRCFFLFVFPFTVKEQRQRLNSLHKNLSNIQNNFRHKITPPRSPILPAWLLVLQLHQTLLKPLLALATVLLETTLGGLLEPKALAFLQVDLKMLLLLGLHGGEGFAFGGVAGGVFGAG